MVPGNGPSIPFSRTQVILSIPTILASVKVASLSVGRLLTTKTISRSFLSPFFILHSFMVSISNLSNIISPELSPKYRTSSLSSSFPLNSKNLSTGMRVSSSLSPIAVSISNEVSDIIKSIAFPSIASWTAR